MFQGIYNTVEKNEVKLYNEDNKPLLSINGTIGKDLYTLFMKEYSKLNNTDNIIIELTTTGGVLSWAYMISQILLRHVGNVEIRVPYYAASGGTIIALSCDEIILSNCGCLGPIDPYVYGLSVPTSVEILKDFNKESWYKTFFSFGIINKIITTYAERILSKLNKDHKIHILRLLKKYGDKADEIYDYFTNSNHHETPIYYNDIPKNLNINIKEDMNMLRKICERNNKPRKDPYGILDPDGINNDIKKFNNLVEKNWNNRSKKNNQVAKNDVKYLSDSDVEV